MRAFAEGAARYEAEPRDVGTIAAAMMIRHGHLFVWTSPRHTATDRARRAVDAWVRLQTTRGRCFGVLTTADLAGWRHTDGRVAVDVPTT